MEQLKKWFEEASVIKVFTCKTHEFIIRKGFKITHYFEDDTYSILDTRFNDFYTAVSEEDMTLLVSHGFIKGTNIIMYNRNVVRVDNYIKRIEDLYVKKAKYKKLLPRNKPFYTKRIRNCSEGIHNYHDLLQFYQAQVEQFEKTKELI